MARLIALVTVCVFTAVPVAHAQQDPFNLTAPVRSLATMFTDLFGPRGLVVDSLATLPGEQSHSAHFNSDFQFNFTQFGTALVGQLVSVPLPSPAGGFTFEFDSSLGVFRRTTELWPNPRIAPIRLARDTFRSDLRISGSLTIRSKVSTSTPYRRSSPTTMHSFLAAAKTS